MQWREWMRLSFDRALQERVPAQELALAHMPAIALPAPGQAAGVAQLLLAMRASTQRPRGRRWMRTSLR